MLKCYPLQACLATPLANHQVRVVAYLLKVASVRFLSRYTLQGSDDGDVGLNDCLNIGGVRHSLKMK